MELVREPAASRHASHQTTRRSKPTSEIQMSGWKKDADNKTNMFHRASPGRDAGKKLAAIHGNSSTAAVREVPGHNKKHEDKAQKTSRDPVSAISDVLLHPHHIQKVIAEGESNESQGDQEDRERIAQLAGVESNKQGDLEAFMVTFLLNSLLCIGGMLAFPILRRHHPRIYAENERLDIVPRQDNSSSFAWLLNSLQMSSEDVEVVAGLDQALLLDFLGLCIQIVCVVSGPLLLVFCPLHLLGGGEAMARGDLLGCIGMGNVAEGSWIFWVHAGAVWYVVLMVQTVLLCAQRKFVERRQAWLLAMNAPSSTTLLVEGIPDRYCTDAALKRCFEFLFAESVENAFVVKKTEHLRQQQSVVDRLMKRTSESEPVDSQEGVSDLTQQLGRAKQQAENERLRILDACAAKERLFKTSGDTTIDYLTHFGVNERPGLSSDCSALKDDLLSELAKVFELDPQPSTEQRDPSLYSTCGFVTFKTRRSAHNAQAMSMSHITNDTNEFILSTPPDPLDVLYGELQSEPEAAKAKLWLGYLLILLLFVVFTPCIFLISAVSSNALDGLRQNLPWLDTFLDARPSWNIAIRGYLGTLSLLGAMSLVPSVLIVIFQRFFRLHSTAIAQIQIQKWYFLFHIIYVLLVLSMGSSLIATTEAVAQAPGKMFLLLAESLPRTSHFYLHYITLQWVDNAKELLRLPTLAKFRALRLIFEEDQAKELAEPEDQHYSGMGSRCARFSFLMAMTLTLCTVTPLIGLLAICCFLLCRVVYGYLVVFAETPKPDLGGTFWVTNLKCISWSLLIFIALLAGVLYERAGSVYPSLLAFSSLGLWAVLHSRFEALSWEFLSVEQPSNSEKAIPSGRRPTQVRQRAVRESSKYEQVELLAPDIFRSRRSYGSMN